MDTNTDTNIDTFTQLLHILKNVDWQKFHNLCECIGKDLNEPQLRFLKAIFLETAIASYSNNKLTYVGDSQRGCDFIVESLGNLKLEMKYVEGALYTGKKLTLKKVTSDIKLMNSNGTNVHTELPETYSDYLLLVESNGAALISKEVLQKYIVVGGDGIKAKLPTEVLSIVFEPTHISQTTEKTELNVKSRIMQTIQDIILSI